MKDYNKEIKKGEIGVVIMVFKKPREAYEVEVLDEKGCTKAQCTFLPNELELI